ncbi:MAG: serine--tRNA ligase [Chloroflexi bacterium]|nr:serine--tRNA ligase [Chloroflexota bacterium]
MIDLQLLRQQPEIFREALRKRGEDIALVDEILAADEARRKTLSELETRRNQRNVGSKEIGRMGSNAERQTKITAMSGINARIKVLEVENSEIETRLNAFLAQMPNIPDADVPLGKDDSENVVIKTVGERRAFDFEPRAHWDLGPALGILDFERGIKLAGSRFFVMSGAGAKLQRALLQWLLDFHIAQGYREFQLPYLVKEDIMFGAGQLPKFRDNLYRDYERDAWLVPTAEVPLTGLHADEILDAKNLPLNYTAYTPCFRKEPMSAGKDVRGIKRVYQFDKVEMYKYCLPEESEKELEKLLNDAIATVAALGLPYRVKNLCTGDLGFSALKTYDIEVWAPGVNEWLEVSSCSNVGDFQARRSNIRFRREAGAKTEFVHTLNGSGLGVPRTMIAILENNQQKDGSVAVPEVLREYVKMDVIK